MLPLQDGDLQRLALETEGGVQYHFAMRYSKRVVATIGNRRQRKLAWPPRA